MKNKLLYFHFWKKLLLIGMGYVIAFIVGVLAIAPVGPGSEWMMYVVLFLYSLLVIICNSGVTNKAIGAVLALVFLVLTIWAFETNKEFSRKVRLKHETGHSTGVQSTAEKFDLKC